MHTNRIFCVYFRRQVAGSRRICDFHSYFAFTRANYPLKYAAPNEARRLLESVVHLFPHFKRSNFVCSQAISTHAHIYQQFVQLGGVRKWDKWVGKCVCSLGAQLLARCWIKVFDSILYLVHRGVDGRTNSCTPISLDAAQPNQAAHLQSIFCGLQNWLKLIWMVVKQEK